MFRATCLCGRELQLNHAPPEMYFCGTEKILDEGTVHEQLIPMGGCGNIIPRSKFVDDKAVTDA